jgi:hypothetical protein
LVWCWVLEVGGVEEGVEEGFEDGEVVGGRGEQEFGEEDEC